MDEWFHNCEGAKRGLLVPKGEQCDRCGLGEPRLFLKPDDWVAPQHPGEHYFDAMERWLGFGSTGNAGVSPTPARTIPPNTPMEGE